MTRVFDEEGNHIPVTVLKLIKNVVSQVKTLEKDGYSSMKVAYGEKREKLLSKPKKGELQFLGDEKFLPSKSIELPYVEGGKKGDELSPALFIPGANIQVTGTSKGKGFAGVMKRYNFSGGPAAHGSKFHRTTGSIGNRATPGKVWKGKKMPGHMGAERKTVKNLKVQEINAENGYILVKGSVPGHKNSFVRLKLSKKGK
jgi:large subunit ribosomal protein L3